MLENDLQALPQKPGVYMMLDEKNKILYVGKAVSLRNRVRSYFQPSRNLDPRIELMVRQVARVDYIITSSELEALILESNLIKENKPKYNIRLRDDKAYPYLKVTWDEDFPQIQVVRRRSNDGARYYGPYTDVLAMRETLRLLRRIFPLRSCKMPVGKVKTGRPCLNFHIQRCLAPCAGKVTKEIYREIIKQVCLFLEGRQDELLIHLRRKMEDAAKRLDFEKAAVFRNRIQDIQKVQEKQKVSLPKDVSLDVIGLAKNDETACIQVFQVRYGRLNNREHYYMDLAGVINDAEIIAAFMMRYYMRRETFPQAIILPVEPENFKVIGEWLHKKSGRRIKVTKPVRGERKQLLQMAVENAELLLKRNLLEGANREEKAEAALEELARWLKMERAPERMECFDISNTQGSESVASMVVFINGLPAKSEYRKFKIKSVTGPDDFASLQEAVRRRFLKGEAERREGVTNGKFSSFPDLLVIDGGKGQLSGVCQVLDSLNLDGIKAIGLAKEEEKVYLREMSEPLNIPGDSEALYLLQRIRDEAHRFALAFHRQLRAKSSVKSALDEIPGIGPRKKQALLQKFGSIKRIKEAGLEELMSVKGITQALAEKIRESIP